MVRRDYASADENPARKAQVLIVVLLVAFGAAILWSILVPAHTDYSESAKVTEVTAIVGVCRMNVAAFTASRKAFPGNASEAGCPYKATTHSYGLRVSGGRIDVTVRRIHRLEGKVLSLQATTDPEGTRLAKNGEPVRGWRCSTNAETKAYRYLPASCRQPPLPP
jgi:type IV pilus assembly protein PilA